MAIFGCVRWGTDREFLPSPAGFQGLPLRTQMLGCFLFLLLLMFSDAVRCICIRFRSSYSYRALFASRVLDVFCSRQLSYLSLLVVLSPSVSAFCLIVSSNAQSLADPAPYSLSLSGLCRLRSGPRCGVGVSSARTSDRIIRSALRQSLSCLTSYGNNDMPRVNCGIIDSLHTDAVMYASLIADVETPPG